MCMCVYERERERESASHKLILPLFDALSTVASNQLIKTFKNISDAQLVSCFKNSKCKCMHVPSR